MNKNVEQTVLNQAMKEIVPLQTIRFISWARALEIVREIVALTQDTKANIIRILELIEELRGMFSRAEQLSGYAIDWNQLINLLLPIVLEIIKGIDWGSTPSYNAPPTNTNPTCSISPTEVHQVVSSFEEYKNNFKAAHKQIQLQLPISPEDVIYED